MISVREQLSSEDQIIERLQTAIKENDAETLAYLLRFAPDFDRRLALNLRTYEAARLCGYDPEIKFDRCGWLKTEKLEEKCEVIRHEGKNYSIMIYILQHPNGNWVVGHNVNFPTCGSSSSPGIFNNQYSSRTEAVRSKIDDLIDYAERSGDTKVFKEAVNALRKQKADLCQLSLFA